MESTKNKSSQLIEHLFTVGAHFGYTKARRHPSAKPYIFGVKNRVEIFDLEKTSKTLEDVLAFVKSLGETKTNILFVGGKNEARAAIKIGAESIGMPYVAGRWIGGTLTNFSEIRKRINKLETLTAQREKGELSKYTKKERLLIDREIENLREYFEGLLPMKELPKVIFIVDSKKEHTAVAEAKQKGIKIIGLCGSDCDLKEVDYPIPANDASIASISFFINQIVNTYKEGKK